MAEEITKEANQEIKQATTPEAATEVVAEVTTQAPKATAKPKGYYTGVGRRKESVATIKITNGKGIITVNDMPAEKYFSNPTYLATIKSPLVLLSKEKTLDISVRVNGGGSTGQAEAVRLGIARAILGMSEDFRTSLRKEGMLTRDARVKERKKPGLRKARKAPQFSKR